MIFNITYDQSPGSLPAGFVNTINAVVSFFQSTFTDSVTVDIDVGFGEVNNHPLSGGALGESLTFLSSYTYTQIINALSADASSSDDASAVGSLGNDPIAGNHFYWVATAEAKALGLPGGFSSPDGFVGFTSAPNIFDFDRSNGVTGGQYDFYGVVAHEFSEVMGRQLLVGGTIGGQSPSYEPLDLFHYSSPGVRIFVGTPPPGILSYFSLDGGTTNLDNFNTNPNGDFGDWAATAAPDAALAFGQTGHLEDFTPTDVRVMDVIGWNVGPPPPRPDLTASNFVLTVTGGNVSVGYHINNIGTVGAGASTARIFISSDSTITAGDTLLATVGTPALGPGGTDIEGASVVFPGTLIPGTYFVGALADATGQISESSESNNGSNVIAVILGNGAANTMTGTSANDIMFGFNGSDTLNGGLGADIMVGGTGNDTYFVDNAGDVVTENPGGGTDTIKTTLASYTLASDLENLTFIGTGDFNGVGNALANIMTGGTGNDTLNAGAGADTLDGGAGADIMTGGLGNDIFVVDNAGDVVNENPGEGTDTVKTTLSSYTLGNDVENLTYIGGGNFNGVGNGLGNTITGGIGNDVLNGGDGNDTLIGGGGADSLFGGLGNDSFRFSSAAQLVAAALIDGGAGSNTVRMLAAASLSDSDFAHIAAGTIKTVQVTGVSSVILDANAQNAGISAVTAGPGNTTITDNRGILASVSATGLAAGQTLTLDGSNTAHIATVSLNAGNLAAGAHTGALTVVGGAGANTVLGGSGGDTITGGGAADMLTGGLGADKFVYAHVADSTVTIMDDITDFTQAQGDQINLHAFLLSNHNVTNTSVGSFQGNSTVAGFFGTNSVVVQHFGGAEQVYVDVNHNGAFDPASDLAIHLDNIAANLTGTDFFF